MTKEMAEATLLIGKLRDALRRTKADAETYGCHYRGQTNCVKALKAADCWLAARP